MVCCGEVKNPIPMVVGEVTCGRGRGGEKGNRDKRTEVGLVIRAPEGTDWTQEGSLCLTQAKRVTLSSDCPGHSAVEP